MKDSYPESIDIEFNRPALKRYLRRKWFFICLWFTGPGAICGFGVASDYLKTNPHMPSEMLTIYMHDVAIGSWLGAMTGIVCYALFAHRTAARHAESIQVRVEGSFLRIRLNTSGISDRKIHFRSIIDYEVHQDSRMQSLEIYALRLMTTGAGPHGVISIHGVKDGLRVRDMLAEVDRLRENA